MIWFTQHFWKKCMVHDDEMTWNDDDGDEYTNNAHENADFICSLAVDHRLHFYEVTKRLAQYKWMDIKNALRLTISLTVAGFNMHNVGNDSFIFLVKSIVAFYYYYNLLGLLSFCLIVCLCRASGYVLPFYYSYPVWSITLYDELYWWLTTWYK